MYRLRTIRIGTCSLGPVVFRSQETAHKHVISIANYDKYKHPSWITCKTTTKHHDKIYPGEFLLPDLFSKGQTKVQPYNVLRIEQAHLNTHKFVGIMDDSDMPKFELGLRLGIKKGFFSPAEILEIADSWQPFFTI
jgi:hypothetical protein